MVDNINLLDPKKLPYHVAVIMDGNGRWAKQKGMMRTFGHQNAIEAVRDTIAACGDLKIPFLTLFAFSSENWNRPAMEVNLLMNLLISTLKKEAHLFHDNEIKLNVIGETSRLPKNIFDKLEKLIIETKDYQKSTLTIALSYGAKDEILNAVKKIGVQLLSKSIDLESINETLFEDNLYTKNVPNVDLLIRTSGEYRISNFLLWQIAYAELYFTDVLWPDFRKKDFFEAIINYQKRERRFGKLKEEKIQ